MPAWFNAFRHNSLLLGCLVSAVTLGAVWALTPPAEDVRYLAQAGAQFRARILRDTYGIPHIYGDTDADVAFGLAYAHAEDDFITIQQGLLAARGELARVYGATAAPNDYMVGLLRVADQVQAGYDTQLSPEFRAVVEAYAIGLNRYAGQHPHEVLPGLFPVTGRDVVAAGVHKTPLFFGLDRTLAELFADTRQKELSPRLAGTAFEVEPHSNAFAVGPARSANGETFLAVNSHQPWRGPVAWYEAHVHSRQGWHMTGALFPAAPVIIHGHNGALGWAFTVNKPDLTDVYVLTMNPDNPNQYWFDGAWRDLETRPVSITVRLVGRLTVTVQQEALWSVYGPTVRRPHGVYAVRYAGYGDVGVLEQLYRMNKAQTFAEWQTAVQRRSLPMFNVVYADRAGNIYYLYNARLPMRSPQYDWQSYLPGDTAETLWTDDLPFADLPQVFNPAAGFVQNANSTPFNATLGADNPNPAQYPPMLGIERYNTNRAWRLLALLGADDAITEAEFWAYKFDLAYAPESDMTRWWFWLTQEYTPRTPDEREAQAILREWDFRTGADSLGASVMIAALWDILGRNRQAFSPSNFSGDRLTRAQLVEGFQRAVAQLRQKFGTVRVPWGDLNRLIHGPADLPLSGGPDVLRAIYGAPQPDGRLMGINGDSYVLLVTWDAQGQVRGWAVQPFGSAVQDLHSPHYADQAPLFAAGQLRPAWFTEAEVRAHLTREYQP